MTNNNKKPIDKSIYCKQENTRPVLLMPLSPSLSAGEFKTGIHKMSQIISFVKQFCFGVFKTEQNR